MTGPSPQNLKNLAAFIRDAATIGTAVSVVMGFLFWVVITLWGAQLANHATEILRLDRLATQEDVQELSQRVDALSERVSGLAGDQRIAIVDLSRSFVRSPVRPGGDVDAVIYAMRTERGSSCIITRAATIFETESGLRVPGPERSAAGQLPASMTRLRFQYPVPELPPGRTGVWMVGTYDCPWGPVVEEQGPLIFMMES